MNTHMGNKILAFEYILYRLTEWYMSENNLDNYSDFNSYNDLNKLKTIKLHFFVSAINSDKNDLLDIFNRFYAMPYGHVEGDIYNHINELQNFTINSKQLSVSNNNLNHNSFDSLEKSKKDEIDASIISLKKQNHNIVNYNALDLVELSHTWFSWKSMYNFALSRNKKSEIIPQKLIKEEHKNFELI